MLPQNKEGLLAMILESLELNCLAALLRLALVYHMHEIVRQHERHAFTPEPEFLFKMSKYVAKINVEQLAGLLHHYIIRMSICDPEYVSGHAITGATQSELFDCPVQRGLGMVVILQPSEQRTSSVENRKPVGNI